jgi:3',5'-cyclic AMP phosphodiesterase CpdA
MIGCGMKLHAISDLHVRDPGNLLALESIQAHPGDWLIVAGDVGETEQHLEAALRVLLPKFDRLFWTPGNHELWTLPKDAGALRGVAKYERLVALCRALDVVTPEDPYLRWPGEGPPCVIAPMFLLYDYSFRPSDVTLAGALDWAMESGVLCTDEALLHPDPYPSRQAWCAARCALTAARLDAEVPPECQTVLVNHFPLRQDVSQTPAVPRFSLWCGTRQTEDWHLRYRAAAVVSGHLHIRSTRYRDGVRFEEVSLGARSQWPKDPAAMLREILPGPASPPHR